jgi:hypothetical protein
LAAEVRHVAINNDLDERVAMCRRRLKDIPREVVVFRKQFRRATESLQEGHERSSSGLTRQSTAASRSR